MAYFNARAAGAHAGPARAEAAWLAIGRQVIHAPLYIFYTDHHGDIQGAA